MKIVPNLNKGNSYDWKFSTIGGVTRVNIESGSDIAHLHELDQKMWTVLSCPVKGLEIDEKTLQILDSNNDGKIRVAEITAASQWLTKVLTDSDLLLKQESVLELQNINQNCEEGKKLFNSAKQILQNLGLEKEAISIEEAGDRMAIFAKTRFNGDGIITPTATDDESLKALISAIMDTIGSMADRSGEAGVGAEQIESFYANCADFADWKNEADKNATAIFPFGDNTQAALDAYNAVREKIDDYFLRCKLAQFSSDSTNALDVSVSRIEAISDKNLTTCLNEISTYPIARITGNANLPLTGEINPAWQAAFDSFKKLVLAAEFPKNKELTKAEWQSIDGRFAAYKAWKSAKKGELVEPLGLDKVQQFLTENRQNELLELVAQDKALEAEANEIESVDKLLHLYRDFYKLLRNFVTFSDFYTQDANTKAIFQAGTLYVDQRSCDLCIKVNDMAKHNTMASFSGMYLVYCDCFSKQKNATMQIVAVITNGDINDLRVGKNAIFYDREGLDWDATITKIIDNPISIRQAFWSPYRKFGRFVEDKINQFAANQDSKMTNEATSKIGNAGDELVASAKTTEKGKAQPFDIAKFCGIFAAIGMALGYIGAFLVSVATGFLNLTWWQMPLALIGIMLLISGPSMIMAWLKLRKRNLSPVLNANGWAVNAQAFVNIQFGATLTKVAHFPKMPKLQDPFAKKGTPAWRKILYAAVLLGGIFCALYFTNTLAKIGLPYKNEVPEAEITPIPADSAPETTEVPME